MPRNAVLKSLAALAALFCACRVAAAQEMKKPDAPNTYSANAFLDSMGITGSPLDGEADFLALGIRHYRMALSGKNAPDVPRKLGGYYDRYGCKVTLFIDPHTAQTLDGDFTKYLALVKRYRGETVDAVEGPNPMPPPNVPVLVSDNAQAKSLPMLYTEAFRQGVKRVYAGDFLNDKGRGLLDSDKKKRPAYFAAAGLAELLRDGAWNAKTHQWDGSDFVPKQLAFHWNAETPATVHSVVLQKRSGDYCLLLWNEVKNYDATAKRDIVNPAVPVTLNFEQPVSGLVTISTLNADGTYANINTPILDNKLSLAVPDSVMVVKISAPAPVAADTQTFKAKPRNRRPRRPN